MSKKPQIALGLMALLAILLSALIVTKPDNFSGKLKLPTTSQTTAPSSALNKAANTVNTKIEMTKKHIKYLLETAPRSGEIQEDLTWMLLYLDSYLTGQDSGTSTSKALPDLVFTGVPKITYSYNSETKTPEYSLEVSVKNIGKAKAEPFKPAAFIGVGDNSGFWIGLKSYESGLNPGESAKIFLDQFLLEPFFIVGGHTVMPVIFTDQQEVNSLNNVQVFWETVMDDDGKPKNSTLDFYNWFFGECYYISYPFVPNSSYYRSVTDGSGFELLKTRVVNLCGNLGESQGADYKLQVYDNINKKVLGEARLDDFEWINYQSAVFEFEKPIKFTSTPRKSSSEGKPVIFILYRDSYDNKLDARTIVVPVTKP